MVPMSPMIRLSIIRNFFLFSTATTLLLAYSLAHASPAHQLLTRQSPPSPASDTLYGTAPVPLLALATTLPRPTTPDPVSTEAIRNTLALYPFSIDGKNYAGLANVFTTDAIANFSAPIGVATGLPAIQTAIENALRIVTTQHRLTTNFVQVGQTDDQAHDATDAFSATYFIADHFGTGVYEGEVLTAYGQYQDSWRRQDDGGWKIVYRNLVYMGPFTGNLSVFGMQ